MLVKLPLFLAKNPGAVPALRANASALRPPRSYAQPAYYAVHAYRWIDADGASRWVRYSFTPQSEDPASAPDREVPDYLSAEIRDRFAAGGTVVYDLDLEIAGDGDDPHDPTSVWTASERVVGGRLELSTIVEGREDTIFDPMRLPDGIEPSEDPILRFRPRAYGASYAQRTGDATQPPSWAR
jgi:catalase